MTGDPENIRILLQNMQRYREHLLDEHTRIDKLLTKIAQRCGVDRYDNETMDELIERVKEMAEIQSFSEAMTSIRKRDVVRRR
jgi:hypothetical protein